MRDIRLHVVNKLYSVSRGPQQLHQGPEIREVKMRCVCCGSRRGTDRHSKPQRVGKDINSIFAQNFYGKQNVFIFFFSSMVM